LVNNISIHKYPVIYTGASVMFKNIPLKNLKKTYCECTRKTKSIHCGWKM